MCIRDRDSSGRTAMHFACFCGSMKVLQCLLTKAPSINVNKVDSRGRSALYYAFDSIDIFQKLLEISCLDINIKDTNDCTLLYHACKENRKEICKLLLRHSSINLERSGRYGKTPLHFICMMGDLETVKLFFQLHGTGFINFEDRTGRTPLHLAYKKGRLELVRFFLQNYRESDPFKEDNNGNSILNLTLLSRDVETLKLLLRFYSTVDVNKTVKNSQTPIHLAVEAGDLEAVELCCHSSSIDINKLDINGLTPLQKSYKNLDRKITRLLISQPNINFKVDVAIQKAFHENDVETTELLLSYHIEVFNVLDLNGDAPIHLAYRKGNNNIVKLLLSHPKLDVNIANKSGNTVMHYACKRGDLEIVKFLLSNPATDVNRENKNGTSPFQFACKNNLLFWQQVPLETFAIEELEDQEMQPTENVFFEVFQALLAFPGCQVNRVDKKGNTIMHNACINDNFKFVDLLINHHDVDINVRNKWGFTPLFYACKKRNIELIKILLNQSNKPCFPTIANNIGVSPVDWAFEENDPDVFQLLINKEGTNPNKENNEGRTFLSLACERGNKNIVEILLNIPSIEKSVNRYDKTNRSPLHYACRGNHGEVIELLLQHPKIDTLKPLAFSSLAVKSVLAKSLLARKFQS